MVLSVWINKYYKFSYHLFPKYERIEIKYDCIYIMYVLVCQKAEMDFVGQDIPNHSEGVTMSWIRNSKFFVFVLF